eukprot:gene7137-11004_t
MGQAFSVQGPDKFVNGTGGTLCAHWNVSKGALTREATSIWLCRADAPGKALQHRQVIGVGNQTGTEAFPPQHLPPGAYLFEWRHGPPNTSMLAWSQPKKEASSVAFQVVDLATVIHDAGSPLTSPTANASVARAVNDNKRKLDEMEEENAYLRQELKAVAQQFAQFAKGLPDPNPTKKRKGCSSGDGGGSQALGRARGSAAAATDAAAAAAGRGLGGSGSSGGGGGVAVKKGSRVRIFGMQHGEEDLNGNTGTVETINDDGVANVRMHQEGGRVEVFAMENLTPLPKLPTHTSFRSRRK